MKTIIGIILVLAGLYVGYLGYQDISGSKTEANIGDLEISVKDEESSQKGYLLIGAGVIGLVAGLYLVGKKEK